MKKIIFKTILSLLLTAIAGGVTGCGKENVPDPPVERAELTIRLFDALRHQRDEEALRLIEKLQALAPEDADLSEMYGRVVFNRCSRQVQIQLDKGDLTAALKLVQKTRQQYPTLLHLRLLEASLIKLRDLQMAATALAAARTSSELVKALAQVKPLAAAYPDAVNLKKDIAQRREQLRKMREFEQAAAQKTVQGFAESGPQPLPDKK